MTFDPLPLPPSRRPDPPKTYRDGLEDARAVAIVEASHWLNNGEKTVPAQVALDIVHAIGRRINAADPLDESLVQLDSARDLAAALADMNDAALHLHQPMWGNSPTDFCRECDDGYPCPTVRALTGADE